MQHFIFAVAYGYYVLFYFNLGEKISAAVFAAPVLIYGALLLACLLLSRIMRADFKMFFKRLSPALYASLILFITPLAVKFQIPDPHNFALRKLELILAAAYVLTLAYMAYKSFSYILRSGALERLGIIKGSAAVFAVFLTLFFFLSFWFNRANEPTGDEPYYLLTAHSIVNDMDLDIRNNLDNGDYRVFHSRDLEPQAFDVERDGALYSYHPFVFSALISPFYFAAGRHGAAFFMNILTAVFIAMLFYLVYCHTKSSKSAAVAAGITGLGMPVFGISNIVSPDIAAACMVLFMFILLKYHPSRVILFSIAGALAIWLHIRSAPAVAALLLLYALYNIKRPSRIFTAAAVQAAGVVVFVLMNYLVYGAFIPSYTTPEGGGPPTFSGNIAAGLAAFFMDRQLGLFMYAPVFILIPAGLFLILKKSPGTAAEFAFVSLPYMALAASVYDFGGGSSGPRYLIPVIFIFTVMLAEAYSYARRSGSKLIFKGLFFTGAAVSFALAVVPWFRWDRPLGENNLIMALSSVLKTDIGDFFPSFRLEGQNSIALTAVFAALIAAVNILFYLLSRRAVK